MSVGAVGTASAIDTLGEHLGPAIGAACLAAGWAFFRPARVIVRRNRTDAITGRWSWTCQKCGWLGIGLFSQPAALREACRHIADTHSPDIR